VNIPELDDPKYLEELPPGHRQLIGNYVRDMRKFVIGDKPRNATEHGRQQERLQVEYGVVSRLNIRRQRIWGIVEYQGLRPPKVVMEGFATKEECLEHLRKVMVGSVSLRVPSLAKHLKATR